jgi:hypothetical protein
MQAAQVTHGQDEDFLPVSLRALIKSRTMPRQAHKSSKMKNTEKRGKRPTEGKRKF